MGNEKLVIPLLEPISQSLGISEMVLVLFCFLVGNFSLMAKVTLSEELLSYDDIKQMLFREGLLALRIIKPFSEEVLPAVAFCKLNSCVQITNQHPREINEAVFGTFERLSSMRIIFMISHNVPLIFLFIVMLGIIFAVSDVNVATLYFASTFFLVFALDLIRGRARRAKDIIDREMKTIKRVEELIVFNVKDENYWANHYRTIMDT